MRILLKRGETNLSLSEEMTESYFSLAFLFAIVLVAHGNGQDERMILGKLKKIEAHHRCRRLAAYFDPHQLPDSTVPHALTPDMFHSILGELRSVNSQLVYDSDYFMDYASSQYNKCPFQGEPSEISFLVHTGKVEYGKTDSFGLAMALGKSVPYNDLDIRQNLENIARKWKPYSQLSAPRKFGCSIIPNCYGDIVLACAFYPIDITWPFPTSPTSPVYTTSPQDTI